jgi:uronate dehydrogenase
MQRLLITGAAGGLGSVMRRRLAHLAETVRLSDIADAGPAGPNEEVVTCDLGDRQAVHDLVAGCDGVVHFGGISVEDKFAKILNANIVGIYNLYEAVRKTAKPRVIFASSNHVIGFYRQDQQLDARATPRPDGLYGVSKCFGEAMANMYHDKFGIETAIVRIGSCFPEPKDRRMLATWMSADDLVSLVECAFRAVRLGCPVIYGVSDNDTVWWDNRSVAYLGWGPKHNSAAFRDKIHASQPAPAPDDPAALYQGGKFTADPIFED